MRAGIQLDAPEAPAPAPQALAADPRLSLPFVIGIAVQAGFVLSAHWLGHDTVGVVGGFLGCYWPLAVALVAVALARVYWSEASKGARPRRSRVVTLIVLLVGTSLSFVCSILMARLTVFA